MKINFRLIAKIGLLLVVMGFFMPIACDKNGFEIANSMMKSDSNTLYGLLMYVMFASAAAGVIIGIFLLMRRKLNSTIDWLVVILCIVSGVIVYVNRFGGKSLGDLFNGKSLGDMQTGAYLIFAGWIVSAVAQVISTINKEK
jgi:hypothetical protein